MKGASFYRHHIILASTSLLATIATPAAAQSSGSADDGGDQGEIIVTAQKRNASLLDVPLALSALDGNTLSETGVTSLQGLMKQVPALRIDSGYGDEGPPRFNLRGLGNTEYAANATPSVGVYVDEVYLNATYSQSFPLLDIERVEVLRGPQGTLWGKNTTAGLIHAISRKPDGELGGYANLEIASFGRKTIEAAVGAPLIDEKLSIRAAVRVSTFDGYFRNPLLGRRAGGSDSYAARLSLLWTPSPDVDLLLKYDRSNTDYEFLYGHYGLLAGGADSRGITPGDPLYVTSANPFVVSQNPVPRSHMTADNVTATLKYRFGDGYEVTNIAAYIDSSSANYQDDDSAPYVYSNSANIGQARQFSNEIRITSPDDARFSWIVGGYYLYEDLESLLDFYYPDYGDLGFGYNAYFPQFSQKTNSLAAFANVAFKATDRLTISGGARITNERKSDHVMGGTYSCGSSEWFNINSCNLVNQYVDTKVSLSDTVVTWDANISYDISDDIMGYARIAKGFRAGTFNVVAFGPGAIPRLKPENLISYEVGLKGRILDGLAQGSITGFYYDYQNFQAQQLVGAQTILGNTTLTVKGIEADVTLRPTRQWTIGGAIALIDAEYGDYIAPISTVLVPSGTIDLTGKPLVKAPKTTANIFSSLDLPVGDDMSINLRTDWSYASRSYLRVDALADNLSPSLGIQADLLRAGLIQNPYWLGDMSVTFNLNDRIAITGFVRNLTDKLYKPTSATYIDGTPIGGGRVASAIITPVFGAPRTWGGSLRFEF